MSKLKKQVVVIMSGGGGGGQRRREVTREGFEAEVREVGKGFEGSGFEQVVVDKLCVDKGDMEAQGVEGHC